MDSIFRLRKPVKIALGGMALIMILSILGLVGFRLVSGRSLGIKSFAIEQLRYRVDTVKAILDSRNVHTVKNGEFTNVIFLHLSTGNNLIEQGNVRKQFMQAGIDFWDHGYNYQGLRDPQGNYRNYSYSIPGNNTTPEGLRSIFSQKLYSLPVNTFSGLLQHNVIIIKSCFTENDIASNTQLEQYKAWYVDIRKMMDQHPEKLFIILTIPPLNPSETNPEQASRARAFATWLMSEEFLKGHPNISTFDFFGYLAEDEPSATDFNMLRADYREGNDSHPNQLANQTIGPVFVDFVIRQIRVYQADMSAK